MEGFEPPNAGTKNQCLTTWRHPTVAPTNCTLTEVIAQVGEGVIVNYSLESPSCTVYRATMFRNFSAL